MTPVTADVVVADDFLNRNGRVRRWFQASVSDRLDTNARRSDLDHAGGATVTARATGPIWSVDGDVVAAPSRHGLQYHVDHRVSLFRPRSPPGKKTSRVADLNPTAKCIITGSMPKAEEGDTHFQ